MEDEFGQLDWQVPICKEARLWLWFITYTATLTHIDALYLTPTLVNKKVKNNLRLIFISSGLPFFTGKRKA